MKKKNLLISFSGGETSAYMTWWLLNFEKNNFNKIVVVFANTGQEHEETLMFVEKCDRHLNFNTVWLEAIQNHNEKKSASHRIVNYYTANRDGDVYEDMIKKYGIPNQKFPSCTRDLKLAPINSYVKSLGWGKNDYYTAIGIRADEIDRMSSNAKKRNIIYPLIRKKMTKPQINFWWSLQSFRLNLTGYQGNCVWCWKKTDRKHFTLLSENPEFYKFPNRMEEKYHNVGPEFKKNQIEGYKRTFFRKNRSTKDMIENYEKVKNTFEPYHDENQIFDNELDLGSGCGESCEVFADENLMEFEE